MTIATASTPGIGDDPEVRQAVAERDRARAAFDTLDAAWKRLAQQRANADLRGGLTPDLRTAEADARQARLEAWKPVVAANDQLRAATLRAQLRLGETEGGA